MYTVEWASEKKSSSGITLNTPLIFSAEANGPESSVKKNRRWDFKSEIQASISEGDFIIDFYKVTMPF